LALKSIKSAEVKGKNILCRFDFNVPLEHQDEQTIITDTFRIDIAIPTIKYLMDNGAKNIILMSHLGRPKGKIDPKYSLEPIANYLAKELREEIYLTQSPTDPALGILLNLGHVKIIMLENLRYDEREESNDLVFGTKLAKNMDIYLNDAFGVCHRKHASVDAVTTYFHSSKRFAGFLMESEVTALQKISKKPEKLYIALIGGAKVSDKIGVLDKLLTQVDTLLIGGAMAYPFLKAKGIEVGKSLCAPEDVKLAENLLKRDLGGKIQLPIDHVVLDDQDKEDGLAKPDSSAMEVHHVGMDIGVKTIQKYSRFIKSAKTVFWNGPMGMFEDSRFSKGTFQIARAVSLSHAYSVVGGGDSVAAVRKSELGEGISHVSSGGGASLEFIQSGSLPGLNNLLFHH